jgi:hypothetical protein
MKFIKDFSNYNPVLNLKVSEFIERNKTGLLHLWDKEKSEEENIEFLTNYFTEYPELMDDKIDLKKVTTLQSKSSIRNTGPILQNIGGVKDFRSF